MSTPHIEHFVDERGNFICRAEFEGSFLSKDEAKELGKYVSKILDENAKLREEGGGRVSEEMKVYLVRAFWGQYSDKGERIERVFSTRRKAIDYIKGQGIDVYEEDGTTYACWYCDKPTGTAYPKWDGYAWRYEVEYSLDTSAYEVIEMEVDA